MNVKPLDKKLVHDDVNHYFGLVDEMISLVYANKNLATLHHSVRGEWSREERRIGGDVMFFSLTGLTFYMDAHEAYQRSYLEQ
ncbi:hypothetical protein SUGI_0142370 [Cryptomeria japonica]|nr:hypothetical protein SUGI_0142370 [Cryptomeria japonica]